MAYTLNDHPIGLRERCGAPTRAGTPCRRAGDRSSFNPKFRCHQHADYVPPPEPEDENSYGNRLARYLDGKGPMPAELTAPADQAEAEGLRRDVTSR